MITKQLQNIVSGILSGRKSDPTRVRRITQWFICGVCSGSGEITARGGNGYLQKGTMTECPNCSGTGKIKLQFSVERVNDATK